MEKWGGCISPFLFYFLAEVRDMSEFQRERLPKHIAIIMDGNGRWAKSRGLPRTQGHIEGMRRAEEIITYANRLNIQAMTLFTFSTENWTRPKEEISMLMSLLANVLNQKAQKLKRDNVRFQVIGRRDKLPDKLIKAINEAKEITADCTGMVANLAFNYGSRAEILDAVRSIASDVKDNALDADAITEETISNKLYTHGLPDPDLLIRTSGEKRISNFLLWQLSYAEFYFTDKLWPDFHEADLEEALFDFQNRKRRFGDIKEKGES
jgi:undecaprenyl diphosphate synthase